MLNITSWNIAQRAEAWRLLVKSKADIALLQEANAPPADVAPQITADPTPWKTGPNQLWRSAVVKLSDNIEVGWLDAKPLSDAKSGDLGVSRSGTLAAAIIKPCLGELFIAVSVYACWEKPHSMTKGDFMYADASVHRLISDLSVFIGKQSRPNILVAGDLNVLRGHGEHGDKYWAGRYETVFSRMAALGLKFVGPQAPHGRQAEPWPAELPRGSDNVPTYYGRQQSPATCTRQLDFVFASALLSERLRVRALNELDEWGPSDCCRVEIEVS